MALDSYSYDCCVLPPLDWDWDWDELHTTLGLGGAGTGGGGAAQEPSFFFPATRNLSLLLFDQLGLLGHGRGS